MRDQPADVARSNKRTAEIAQRVGQALLEESYYEPETGQLLASSFMDYEMAVCRYVAFPSRSAQRSSRAVEPARRPFRRRGRHDTGVCCGDHAIIDAFAELGVHHIEMPATPERVWRAIRAGRAAAAV